MDEAEDEGYKWIKSYEKTWEMIGDSSGGNILKSIENVNFLNHQKSMRSILNKAPVCVSMIRHLVIVLDVSEAMKNCDYKPNRLKCLLKLLENFIVSFFDQNPISQIAILSTANSDCKLISNLTSQDSKLISVLGDAKIIEGVPSLQNSIEHAHKILETSPLSSSKEILIIYGSTYTCDPGDIYETVKKGGDICISCISLCCEMYILKYLTETTGGRFNVSTSESHLRECLSLHLNFPRQNEFKRFCILLTVNLELL